MGNVLFLNKDILYIIYDISSIFGRFGVTGFFRITGHNFNLINVKLLMFQFEIWILDDESPYFVTESIGVEVTLLYMYEFTCVRFVIFFCFI